MSAQAAEIQDDNLPVGEILRRARVYYNQSIDDVGGILRIRSSHLEAIEEGRIDDLPGRVYAFGFVRAYAEYLGLDGEKIVRLFKNQIGVQVVDRPDLHMPVAASESKSPNVYIIVGSLAVLALAISSMMFMGGRSETAVSKTAREIPPVPQAMYEDTGAVGPFQTDAGRPAPVTDTTTAPQVVTAPEAAAVATAQPADAKPAPLVLKLKDSAWVEIRDVSGKALLSRILKPGDSYIVPASVKGLVLDTGNVGALEFVIDGKTLAPLGEKGDVRRGIKLEPAFLKELDARNPRRAAETARPAGTQAPATVRRTQ